MNTDWNRLYTIAKTIAKVAHNGQVDKAGRPYIEHPLTVADMLNEPDEKVVALLHDVLEDSDFTADDLHKMEFPQDVIDAVCALTRESEESRRNYIRRVKENPLATRVKLADLRHNMDLSRLPSVSDGDLERTERYKKEYEFLME